MLTSSAPGGMGKVSYVPRKPPTRECSTSVSTFGPSCITPPPFSGTEPRINECPQYRSPVGPVVLSILTKRHELTLRRGTPRGRRRPREVGQTDFFNGRGRSLLVVRRVLPLTPLLCPESRPLTPSHSPHPPRLSYS